MRPTGVPSRSMSASTSDTVAENLPVSPGVGARANIERQAQTLVVEPGAVGRLLTARRGAWNPGVRAASGDGRRRTRGQHRFGGCAYGETVRGPYCASKHAVVAIFETLRREL